jgi:hypothetical protein
MDSRDQPTACRSGRRDEPGIAAPAGIPWHLPEAVHSEWVESTVVTELLTQRGLEFRYRAVFIIDS